MTVRIQFSLDVTRRWLALAVGTVLAAALLGITPVVLAHGGSQNHVHACYQREKGSLRWVTASQVCLDSEIPIDWPKRGLANVTVVEATSETSSPTGFTFATCPTGTRLISGGYFFVGNTTNLSANASYPNGNSWLVRVSETDATLGDWSVTVKVLCAQEL